ncbi:FUSC family protein [Synechocystis salina]|uniref:FUSC family protein n=1 Tax=Synechocystis salina LEGE 00031 TaxID=1828736 RepID=A0ABR9VVR7_9SYNC|nr:FUSC family protein [Synechocystis salina]MBE9242357.1 FUSC family protein [Synechocystis salina LEGE 00041]MBE9255449.1 FUSC family protein [Synechocystis salina LEGE 00031]
MLAKLRQRLAFLIHTNGTIDGGRGIRTFCGMAVPYSAGLVLGDPQLGLGIGLASQLILLADVGGLYSVRLKTILGAWIGAAIAMAMGMVAVHYGGIGLIATGLVLFVSGYLTVYGEQGGMVGVVSSFAFLLGSQNVSADSFELISLAIGGLWGLVLAIVIWPFRPNQPLRQMVANNFTILANYLKAMAASSFDQDDPMVQPLVVQLRQNLLKSRQALVESQRGLWGQSKLRELLLVLIEHTERLNKPLMLLSEIINFHNLPQLQTVQILMEDAISALGDICLDLAQMVTGKRCIPNTNRLQLLLQALQQQQTLQKQALTEDFADYNSLTTVTQLVTHLENLTNQLSQTIQMAQLLENPRLFHPGEGPDDEGFSTPAFTPWWEPLKNNFQLNSPLFRHGLRLAIGGMAGLLIAQITGIPYGFWIVLTLIFVLKPDFSLTFQRLSNRLVGTLLGVLVMSIALKLVQDPHTLSLLGILAIALGTSLLRFHYSVAVFFVTAFALILKAIVPEVPTEYALASRLVCTLIGSAIALVLGFSFLRQSERFRFTQAGVKMIVNLEAYFQQLTPALLGQGAINQREAERVRNQSRLAATGMQIALDRFINDPSTPLTKKEPALTTTNYLARLSRGFRVLISHLENSSGSNPPPAMELFTTQVEQSLTDLRLSLENQSSPAALPPMAETLKQIRDYHQHYQAQRIAEIGQQQGNTPIRRYLNDFNLVVEECQQIYQRLETIHSAIARFTDSPDLAQEIKLKSQPS